MILVWYSMRMMWYDRVENIRDWFVLDYYSVLQLIYQSWSSDDCYLNYQVSPFIILCPLPPVFTYNCEECSQAAPSGAGTKDSPALILILITFPLNIGDSFDGLSTVVINQLIKSFFSWIKCNNFWIFISILNNERFGFRRFGKIHYYFDSISSPTLYP